MKMSFNEIQATCDSFVSFLDAKGIDGQALAARGSMDDEIELTLEEARKYGILKKNDCCEGGPQWGHSWDCPKLPG